MPNMSMEVVIFLLVLSGMTMLTVRWLVSWSATAVSPQLIRQLVLQRLLTVFQEVTELGEEEGVLRLQIDGQECRLRYDQLHRRCVEMPAQTGLYLQQAVQAIRQALQDTDAWPADWAHRLFPLLVPTTLLSPSGLVLHPFLPTLQIGYVLEQEEAFRWVTVEELERQALPFAELHALALRNLERSCHALNIESAGTNADGQDRLLRFQTLDGLDAARLLIPSFYSRFSPRFGDLNLVVAIPTRDILMMASAHEQADMSALGWQAANDRAHRAFPLHEELLLVTPGSIVPLSPHDPYAMPEA